MNSFSKTAVFSVALLISGVACAQEPAAQPSRFSKAWNATVATASTAWTATKNGASTAWAKTKAGASVASEKAKCGAKTLWTPSFVFAKQNKSLAKPGFEIPAQVQASVDAYNNAAVFSKPRAYAYRAALISAVVAPVAFAVYKKYGKTIAQKYAAMKKYVVSKLAARLKHAELA